MSLLGLVQLSPLFPVTPGTRVSTMRSRSASSSTSAGDLPPSSRVSCFRVSAAAAADHGAAGEGDLVDARVAHQVVAARGQGVDDVQYTGGQPGPQRGVGEVARTQGRVLRRLHDDGAAGQQGLRQLERGECERGVPRDDGRYDAHRPLLDAGADPRQAVAQFGQLRRVRQGGVVAQEAGHGQGPAAALPDRQAGLGDQHLGDRVDVLLQFLGEPREDLGTLPQGQSRPRAGVERGTGGFDGRVDVLGGRRGGRSDLFLGRGVDDRDALAGGAGTPGVVDEQVPLEDGRGGRGSTHDRPSATASNENNWIVTI
jgi:hypothetical protein